MNNLFMRLASFSSKQVLIFAVLAGVAYYFLLFDDGSLLSTKLAGVDTQLAAEKAKEAESDVALKEVASVQASVGALSEQFKTVSAELPADLQMAEIIRTVDKVAEATGLSVKSKEPKPTMDKDVIQVVPLHVLAEGNFNEITMFFYYLSTIERIVRVKSFVMTTPQDFKKSSRVSLEADVVSYKFLPLAASKALEAGVKK
jgi:Tfp pilus assembly protein PilO